MKASRSLLFCLLSPCTAAKGPVSMENIAPLQITTANSSSTQLTDLWNTTGNSYPTVFLSGLFGWAEDTPILGIWNYWGGVTQNILLPLRKQGYTIVAPGIGPLSSNWERACEAFAALTGDVTDYGIARSERFGHARWGRNYTGHALLPQFADNFIYTGHELPPTKINLVGYSLGGPTARTLTHLLTFGSDEEMQACEDTGLACSPLFWTNKTTTYVNSVFALSGVHQGSILADFLQAHDAAMEFVKDVFALLVGTNNYNASLSLVDLQLDHWNMTRSGTELFPAFLDRLSRSPWFRSQSTGLFDLTVANQAHELLAFVRNSPDTNYFSVAGRTTYDFAGRTMSELSTLFPLMAGARIIATYGCDGFPADVDTRDWRQSDGMVAIASSRGPQEGFRAFPMDMKAGKVEDLVPDLLFGPPLRGVYNYVGEMTGTDHSAFVGWGDIRPGLRDDFYTNVLRVLAAVDA
ncbi:Alpha/Beta hydrolase protein [Chytriomyces sp. MP71]|nr:Alpha/Beta hydrolase protein [Chytriomyces sp. MP71]